MSKMWFLQDSQVGYAYLPKVWGQDATHWRRRVLDMKILAFIYQCQKKPKVFSLWDELAQNLALILYIFSDGVAICIAY